MEKSKKQPKSHTRGLVPNFSTGRNDSKLAKSKNAEGYDNFGVPLEFFSLAKMSRTERKNLKLRLKLELEQIRKFMNKVASLNSNSLLSSMSSDTRSCSNGQKRYKLANQHGSLKVSATQAKKRAPFGHNGPKTKRSIEPTKHAAQVTSSNSLLMNQCHYLLGFLMSQKDGWVFNNPVDIVALKIPDYFTVIKHPMDLGTVKSRITSGQYSSPNDFAADVRLTFSNAMIYNPPGNDVHDLAKTFSNYFEKRWKAIERKIPEANSGGPKFSKPTSRDETRISDQLPPLKKKKVQEKAEPCDAELPSESLQLCIGNEPVEEDVDILGGSDVPVLSFPAVEIEKDDATANRNGRCSNSGGSSSSSSESSSSSRDSSSSSGSESETSESTSDSKGSVGCNMPLYPGKRNHGDSETRKDSMNMIGQIEQSSHSEAVGMEGCLEGESASQRQVSQDKLSRAASLRSRFADTIIKAKEKALEKVSHKPIIEREQFIRRQKEKAQLQAEAKAAEEAQRKAEAEAAAEAKRKREQERQAARQTLENMKKTVDINENSQLLKDMEMLRLGYDAKVGSNPLEELGLDMKLDEEEDEDEELWQPTNGAEEGEID